MNALWIGWGFSAEPSPSSVRIFRPAASVTGVVQERIAPPSMTTVQAPHCARPQPNFGPLRARLSRSTYRSGVSGSTSRVWDVSLTESVIMAPSSHRRQWIALRPLLARACYRDASSSVQLKGASDFADVLTSGLSPMNPRRLHVAPPPRVIASGGRTESLEPWTR